MWIGKQLADTARRAREESAAAELGVTSIGGADTAVVSRGEERTLPVYGPGGLLWLPKAGDTVLVIKGGSGREECCVAGAAPGASPAGMEPGEVRLYSGGASLTLRNDGRIELNGSLYVNGVPWQAPL